MATRSSRRRQHASKQTKPLNSQFLRSASNLRRLNNFKIRDLWRRGKDSKTTMWKAMHVWLKIRYVEVTVTICWCHFSCTNVDGQDSRRYSNQKAFYVHDPVYRCKRIFEVILCVGHGAHMSRHLKVYMLETYIVLHVFDLTRIGTCYVD